MAAIHSANTKPELTLRSSLWHLGYRYRINDKRLPGKPDIVLPHYRTVMFVNGCFWHGHVGCSKFRLPETNRLFWKEKIERNRVRDNCNWRLLEAKGWLVITVWTCELEKARLNATLNRLTNTLSHRELELEKLKVVRREIQDAYQQDRRKRKELEATLRTELQKKYPKQ
jgi:DNA mismatch endonuclease (patch repair protein)